MKFLKIGAAIVLAAAAVPASAALVADYQLNNTLSDGLGGPAITNNGGALGPSGISFAANQGPTLGGFSNTGVYSIATSFRFDTVADYRKIVDFLARGSDTGLYVLSGALNFYPMATGPAAFSAGQLARVVVTRDAAGLFTGYVGNTAQFAFTDSGNLGVIGSELNFFRDDFATSQGEASAGFVDYIRIYDTALTAAEVAALPGGVPGGVPEPASWALMIGGFGLVGGAMRRRVAVAA